MTTPPPAQRWAHTFVTHHGPEDVNQMLARYSADGWELVSHAGLVTGGLNYTSSTLTFTFKRPDDGMTALGPGAQAPWARR
ncbi:hypothetical protein [Actinomadura sp. 9N215]|uniref:hypothetical protein n=1 Tax=Actinomadura sp. 9N215 TaxID=3375150 RepID=UPI003798D87D